MRSLAKRLNHFKVYDSMDLKEKQLYAKVVVVDRKQS
jgi:hypothetical protein